MDTEVTHALGEGFLTLPKAERDSGRWGTVYLTDTYDTPILLHGVPTGRAVALTAAVLPDTEAIALPIKRELLGAGAAFTELTGTGSRTAAGVGVGVRPVDGRLTDWLFGPTVGRLLGRRVLLEAHVAWPICTCGLLTTPGASAPEPTP